MTFDVVTGNRDLVPGASTCILRNDLPYGCSWVSVFVWCMRHQCLSGGQPLSGACRPGVMNRQLRYRLVLALHHSGSSAFMHCAPRHADTPVSRIVLQRSAALGGVHATVRTTSFSLVIDVDGPRGDGVPAHVRGYDACCRLVWP